MKTRSPFVLGALAALACAGCAGSLDAKVRKRASLDFSCAPHSVRILDRSDNIVRVAGCGAVATYECKENMALKLSCDRVVWDDPQAREVTVAGGKYSISPR
jgi:hypothetical protein